MFRHTVHTADSADSAQRQTCRHGAVHSIFFFFFFFFGATTLASYLLLMCVCVSRQCVQKAKTSIINLTWNAQEHVSSVFSQLMWTRNVRSSRLGFCRYTIVLHMHNFKRRTVLVFVCMCVCVCVCIVSVCYKVWACFCAYFPQQQTSQPYIQQLIARNYCIRCSLASRRHKRQRITRPQCAPPILSCVYIS